MLTGYSEALALALRLYPDDRFRFHDPASGRDLLSLDEAAQAQEEAEDRLRESEAARKALEAEVRALRRGGRQETRWLEDHTMSWMEIWQNIDWQAGWAFLDRGGGLMYLLLLCSVLVLAITLERWLRIRRARTNTDMLFSPVEAMISRDDMAGAYAHVRFLPRPAGRGAAGRIGIAVAGKGRPGRGGPDGGAAGIAPAQHAAARPQPARRPGAAARSAGHGNRHDQGFPAGGRGAGGGEPEHARQRHLGGAAHHRRRPQRGHPGVDLPTTPWTSASSVAPSRWTISAPP